MHPSIAAELADHGVVSVGTHPMLRSTLSRLTAAGALANPLPGIYLPADDRSRLGWLRAVTAWSAPHGVLHARSAAALWLSGLDGPVAFLAHPSLRSRRGVVVSRHPVPPEFVQVDSGIRFASPAYSAVELAATDDGRAICECLRRQLCDQDALARALATMGGARGQQVRRMVVKACAGNPWSYAELRLHRILWDAGITDWVANRPLRVLGTVVWPDVRFLRSRLVLEFDGRETHGRPDQFLGDRERQNLIEAADYRVLRFGWEHLDQPAYVVRMVRIALRSS